MATVRKRAKKDGSATYAVLFRHGPRQRSLTFNNLRSAETFRKLVDALGAERALAEYEEHEGMTLDELAARFFEWKRGDVRSDRTVADYERDYRNWISPRLGHRTAKAITEGDVQDLVDHMRAKLAPKSVADRHAILHGIYKYASAPSRNLVAHNPCIGTSLPKRVKKPPKGLRPAEWQALSIALRQINPDAADLAEFLVASGWRWSEATALSPFDVEDDGDTLFVTMGRVMRRNAAGQVEVVEDEAKSAAGLRRIKLDPHAAEIVRRRVRVRTPLGLVFTTSGGAQWNYGHFRARCWVPAVEAAGLTRKPTPHWLRHSHAAWMLMSGASLAELQRRMGHENITTTVDVYGRMVADVSDTAIDAFAALRDLEPSPRRPEIEGP